MTTTITDLDDFKALDPFFRIIEEGLDGIADGGHFFDLLAEDVIFDYIITTPGHPRHVEGRKAVAELYRPYGTMIVLDRCPRGPSRHQDRSRGARVRLRRPSRSGRTCRPSTWRPSERVEDRHGVEVVAPVSDLAIGDREYRDVPVGVRGPGRHGFPCGSARF
jgi:hypothetical protein